MSPQKKPAPYRASQKNTRSRSFDGMLPPPQPQNNDFPTVGMTLSSYGNNAGSAVPRPPRQSKHPRARRFGKRTALVLLAIFLLAAGWLGWKFVYNAQRLFNGGVFSALGGKLDGEDQGRVNILLAGNSVDDKGHQGGMLTDSIMILSVDTKNNTGFMLSVPRDLYVSIPGGSSQKINAVYPAGERTKFSEEGYANGGMGLLQKVIDQNLGLKTHYYALVNYNALRDSVNSVGGITVTINSSDSRGLYDPSRDYSKPGAILVKLSNGTHNLDGQEALNLARARGEGRGSYGFSGSDFVRTTHQRQIILAIRSKATSTGVLTNPIKIGKLFDSIGANVDTDMTLGNVRRLYDITKAIEGNDIKSIGLNDADGKNLLKNYRTPRGESALIPAAGINNYSDIRTFIRRLTTADAITREAATISILNGTSYSGLAARESQRLEKKRLQVEDIADADMNDYAVTKIIDRTNGSKPASLAALKKAYPGAQVAATDPFEGAYNTSFVVVVGIDRGNAEKAEN